MVDGEFIIVVIMKMLVLFVQVLAHLYEVLMYRKMAVGCLTEIQCILCAQFLSKGGDIYPCK